MTGRDKRGRGAGRRNGNARPSRGVPVRPGAPPAPNTKPGDRVQRSGKPLALGSSRRTEGAGPRPATGKPATGKPAASTRVGPVPRSPFSGRSDTKAKSVARPQASGPDAPARPTRAAAREAATQVLSSGVQTLTVDADEAGMRVDRFLVARFPQLAFTHIQRIVRKGELRVNGKRARPDERLEPGQAVRVPPLRLEDRKPAARPFAGGESEAAFLKSITLYEDKDVMVLNKPMGLAVQGGSGTTRHLDGLLEALRDGDGQKPRLVHRLDKDTAGCLVVAKTRLAAATLAKSFRSRAARKIYWALVAGVPRVRQGRVSTYLAREEAPDGDSRMRIAAHGDDGASHAVTYYAVVEHSGQKLAWLSMKPVTGRTHQLRAHAAHIGHPIVGDPKYFNVENWELPGGIQKKLHLLARRIVIPHPRTGMPIDVTAPLPPHMAQTWNLLGLDTDRYDPIVDAPEE